MATRGMLLGCLILLQGVDFLLTWILIGSGHRNDVYEANPLALSILTRYGWLGLGLFKMSISVVAALALFLLWRYRAATARRLAVGLCAVMLAVVGYSGVLLARPPVTGPTIPELHLADLNISHKIDHLRQFIDERQKICAELLDGSLPGETAIQRMAVSIQTAAPYMVTRHRMQLPSVDRPTELAGYLFHHATRQVRGQADASLRIDRARRQLSAACPEARLVAATNHRGHPIPWNVPTTSQETLEGT